MQEAVQEQGNSGDNQQVEGVIASSAAGQEVGGCMSEAWWRVSGLVPSSQAEAWGASAAWILSSSQEGSAGQKPATTVWQGNLAAQISTGNQASFELSTTEVVCVRKIANRQDRQDLHANRAILMARL